MKWSDTLHPIRIELAKNEVARLDVVSGISGYAIIRAFVEDSLIGELEWYADDGLISYVYVVPEYRRNGVARAMLMLAQQFDPTPVHDWDDITYEGRQWALAMEREINGAKDHSDQSSR